MVRNVSIWSSGNGHKECSNLTLQLSIMTNFFIAVLSFLNIVWFVHLFRRASDHGFEILSPTRFVLNVVLPILIAVRAIKKRKLSLNGAILAFWMGMCTCIADVSLFVSLLTFYITSNRLTKWKALRKVSNLDLCFIREQFILRDKSYFPLVDFKFWSKMKP